MVKVPDEPPLGVLPTFSRSRPPLGSALPPPLRWVLGGGSGERSIMILDKC